MDKSYNKWDIILINIETGGKILKRPALILSPEQYNTEGFIVILPITSNISSRVNSLDYKIKHWKESGLPKPSLIKLRFATIPTHTIDKKIGALHEEDVFNLLNLI